MIDYRSSSGNFKQKYPSLVTKLDLLIERISKAETSHQFVQKAYLFATKAHEGQLRVNGRPYILHPIEVSLLARSKGFSLNVVIAALLHDVIEDTPVTYEDIQENFGREVADLVIGVTRLTRLPGANALGEKTKQDRLDKAFIAISTDIRVIPIKLCDRLTNMRDLYHLPIIKWERISKETIEIFIPLAQRFGLNDIAQELTDLSTIYLDSTYQNVLGKFSDYREKYVDGLTSPIVSTFSDHFASISQAEENSPFEPYIQIKSKEIETITNRLEKIETTLSALAPDNLASYIGIGESTNPEGLYKWSKYLLAFSKRVEGVERIISNKEASVDKLSSELVQANQMYGGILDVIFALALQSKDENILRLLESLEGKSEFLVNNQLLLEDIYKKGLEQDRNVLNHILSTIERVEIRQSAIASTVESLRRWAKAVQQIGLPSDSKIRAAIESLTQDTESTGGISQYLEINLPLVPGILNYKTEIGSEHKAELKKLWNKLKKD